MADSAEAALVAAIEANPDDVEAYYVYGDWLQAQGDPRGELVMLQAAAQRNPDDKKLAARADKHLRDHADALLGPLAEYGKQLTVVWRNGFVRDATVEITGDLQLAAVRALVRHPAGRFIQSLHVGRGNGDMLVGLLV